MLDSPWWKTTAGTTTIIAGVLAMSCAGSCCVFGLVSPFLPQPDRDAPPAPPPVQKVEAPPAPPPVKEEKRTPVASITAAQLLREYQGNEIGADQRYKGKWIEVTGMIDRVGRDVLDQPYVSIRSDDRFSIFTVQCFFSPEWNLGALQPNTLFTVRGVCDGKFANVLLKHCECETD